MEVCKKMCKSTKVARNQHKNTLGDSLAVELPALDRATLVRIQVPQPIKTYKIIKAISIKFKTSLYKVMRVLTHLFIHTIIFYK